ncbi:cytochrome c3 family protein [Planctomycetota bacterium]
MHSKRFFRMSELIHKKFRLLILFVEVLVIGLAGCASFDYLTRVTEQFPRAKQCGKCHVEIYREWSVSDHAEAYVNPHYRQMTDDYAFGDCLSCHVPQPTVSDQPPTARSMHLAEGITCVSCHLEEGKLSGPIEPTGKIAPHPIGVRPEFYNDSIVCGVCHEGTYTEWKSVESNDKKTCQDCHMSPVRRKVTQGTGGFSNVIVSLEKETELKRHDFAVLTTGQEGPSVSFEVQRSGSDIELVFKNNLPHALPTGDFGYRVLVLKISAIDARGNEVSLKQREFAKELDNAILAKGTVRLHLDTPPKTRAIRIHLVRQSYKEDQVLDLMDIEIPLQ